MKHTCLLQILKRSGILKLHPSKNLHLNRNHVSSFNHTKVRQTIYQTAYFENKNDRQSDLDSSNASIRELPKGTSFTKSHHTKDTDRSETDF